MAKEGLWVGLCVGIVFLIGPANAGEERDGIANALATQTAMQQARDHLLHNQSRQAVEVLEAQLTRINGNSAYLQLLRDAYRGYIKELSLANQEDQARLYTQRLAILEPRPGTSGFAKAAASGARGANATLASGEPGPVRAGSAAGTASPPSPNGPGLAKPAIVRGFRQDDEDPFKQMPLDKQRLCKDLLARADREFTRDNFRDADKLFQKAFREDANLPAASKDRWAYSKMSVVVDELNHQSTAYTAMEQELRSALDLSPRLDYGKKLLAEVDKRKGRPAASEEVSVRLRDLGKTAEGWSVAETENFRIYSYQTGEWVEKAAKVAEKTRRDMYLKWFGAVAQTWNPKCELYLHATGQEYSRLTGTPASSPGHSSFQLDGGRVISRRIDLHVDDPGTFIAVLPHEATHVVLAGNFGDQNVPRWVDEGIAVLTEPRDKIDRHLRNLPRQRQDRQLFGLAQLLQMKDYPDPQYVGAFYAESVSVVEFLSQEKGPQVFVNFVRDGLRGNYETALQKHYGFQSFDDLEQHWVDYAFGSNRTASIGR